MTRELTDEQIEALVQWQGDPNDPHYNRVQHARAVIAADRALRVPMTDEEILAAAERIARERTDKDNALMDSRVGRHCARCGVGKLFKDSNGYHTFLRCDGCNHVPMFTADGKDLYERYTAKAQP